MRDKKLENTQKYRKTKKGILTISYHKQKTRYSVDYSLKELHNIYLNDKKFNRLFIEWEKKNYNIDYKPTIDRINCMKHYTLDNIQCLSWQENRFKQRMELKRIRAKTVYQILGNTIVKIHKSVGQAAKSANLHQGNISSCLHGKRTTCGGFKWTYENPNC